MSRDHTTALQPGKRVRLSLKKERKKGRKKVVTIGNPDLEIDK